MIPPVVALVVSALVVSAALGAGTAFLVAGLGLPKEVASAGPRVSVQPSSADFPIAVSTPISDGRVTIAQRAGTEGPSAGRSGPAWTTSSHARSSGADDGGSATGPEFAPEPATGSEPSHSGQGGTTEPAAGSSPAASPHDEESSEPEAPPEDPSEPEAPPEVPSEPESVPEEQPGEWVKVAICHKAGSTNATTLTVGASEVVEHLLHGDTLGACP